MNEYLKVTRNGQILEITLDRPKANAIDGPSNLHCWTTSLLVTLPVR